MLADAGFDWVLLDTEHSPNELPMVQNQLDAMLGGTATAVVRVPWNDMVIIKRYLDIGAQTLLLPYVQTAEEAKDAVRYTRYPPQGMRGVAGSTRANRYGRVKDYFKRVHDELCLLLQVETRTALSNLEAIAEHRRRRRYLHRPQRSRRRPGLSRQLAASGSVESDGGRGETHTQGRQGARDTGRGSRRQALPRMGYLFVAVGSDLGMLARGSEALAAKFKS